MGFKAMGAQPTACVALKSDPQAQFDCTMLLVNKLLCFYDTLLL